MTNNHLRKSVAVLGVLAALAVASPATAHNSGRGLTCKYRVTYATLIIDGYDNEPLFCQTFSGGGTFRRFWGTPSGRLACRYESLDADVRISVYAKSSSIGRAYCRVIRNTVYGQFERTR